MAATGAKTPAQRNPDFFIAGAPKCGTTALDAYLDRHPQLYMAAKETHFFATDLQAPNFIKTRVAYDALFRDAEPGQLLGESSVWYLYSREAAACIHAANPRAKIIIMLRSPLEMLPALHAQNIYNANEDILDFGEALAAEAERRAGRRLPARKALPDQCLWYRETARYTEQVRRYLERFGAAQVHVILFDDFRRDTEAAFRGVLEFLGVSTDYQGALERINPAKRVLLPGVHQFIHRPPGPLRTLARALAPQALRVAIKEGLNRITTREAPRAPLSPVLREALAAEFADEVAALGALLGRDLSHWLQAG